MGFTFGSGIFGPGPLDNAFENWTDAAHVKYFNAIYQSAKWKIAAWVSLIAWLPDWIAVWPVGLLACSLVGLLACWLLGGLFEPWLTAAVGLSRPAVRHLACLISQSVSQPVSQTSNWHAKRSQNELYAFQSLNTFHKIQWQQQQLHTAPRGSKHHQELLPQIRNES